MQKNKLITLLQHLPGQELALIRKYINSPFFNENAELVKLFDAVVPFLHSDDKTDIQADKLGLWAKVFPDKPYHDTRFRRICSDLLKLVFDYLAYKQFKKLPLTSSLFLLPQLSGPQLDKHFAGVIRQMNKELQRADFRDSDFHYINYMLLQRKHEHLEHTAKKSSAFEFIEKSDYHLDCYYFSKKLQLYSDALGFQSTLSGEATVQHFPDFFNYLKGTPYMQEPAVKAWYLVVLMIQNKEDELQFQQLKKLVDKEGRHFQKKELQMLFIHLMNYCIDTKINNGRTEYYQELFSLYKTALDQKIIFENGELSPHHYKNIITISLHVKEFNWVEKFIEEHTHYLPKAERENALNFNLANLYFHKKEYEKVIEQLREVEYKSIVYAIGSKLILARTYYELEEDFALESLIDSFRIYLQRNRFISKEIKQQCMNFLRFTKKLLAGKTYDKTKIEKLKLKIENCKAVATKKWLLQKVDEL